MSSGSRKLALTAHVTTSVGWLGAVVAFLGLAVVGLVSSDVQVVRAVYLVMDVTGWYVLIPFAVASLLTGLLSSLGSTWGLLRYYWVLFKLAINVAATILLVLYMQTLSHLSAVAAEQAESGGDVQSLRSASPVVHAAAALVLLLVAVALSIYKPKGVTPYGWRRQRADRARSQAPRRVG